jgi:hypothetical protein
MNPMPPTDIIAAKGRSHCGGVFPKRVIVGYENANSIDDKKIRNPTVSTISPSL